MRIRRTLALGAASLALVLSACAPGGGSSPTAEPGTPSPAGSPTSTAEAEKPTIIIGSAGFYESQLMAEIYAQALEAAGYTVERNLGIGTREETQPAIESGQIDMMPEYIGSELAFLGREAPPEEAEAFTPTGDSDETHGKLAAAIEPLGLSVLDYTPAQDTNAFVVRQETADEFALETIGDLAPVATQLVWGLPPECETNPLCAGVVPEGGTEREGGLAEYGINYDELQIEPLATCDAPIATALNDGVVDVAELCSTQPDIERFNFVVLEDDLATQPAENIAPIVRTEWLDAAPEDFTEILNMVSAAMDTETLTSLGVQVAVDQQATEDVARQWLEDNGLI
jgi:osmoprotectant transport system substrate-binding protein